MRGFCAIGVDRPKNAVNVGTLWRTAAIFDCAFLFTVGRRFPQQASDTLKTHRHIPIFEYPDVDDLTAHLPAFDTPLIGIELDARARRLSDWHHPERAVYILGAEDHGLSSPARHACDALVQIPTPRALRMNVATAGAVLLYDRWAKAGAA